MRKFIANILYAVLFWPLGWLIDVIYPQGTQKVIKMWLDPDDNEKIRFQMITREALLDFAPSKKNSTGIKIKDWEKMVDEIKIGLIWRNKK